MLKKRTAYSHSRAGLAVLGAAAFSALFFAACFSPLDGTGEIRIGAPRGSRTAVPDADELAGMVIKVSFSGQGGTVREEFGSNGGSVRLAAGTWHVIAKAYNSGNDSFSAPRLRGIYEGSLSLQPGDVCNIQLKSCIGISSDGDAMWFNSVSPWIDDDVLLVVTGSFTINQNLYLLTGKKYTIIAEPETTQTLFIDSLGGGSGFTIIDSTLVLGRQGETGALIINGNNAPPAAYNTADFPPFYVGSDGELEINGNTEITLCKSYDDGGAILIGGGTVTMNSGKIHGNAALAAPVVPSTLARGGALAIAGGTFNMNGGEISGNTAPLGGGGVALLTGASAASFNMAGGSISNNTAGKGGGVYLDSTLTTLTTSMNGGMINGNTANEGQGGGVYVGVDTIFNLEGGIISNNTADGISCPALGGGIYCAGILGLDRYGRFEIRGNQAIADDEAAGGGIFLSSDCSSVTYSSVLDPQPIIIDGNTAKSRGWSATGGSSGGITGAGGLHHAGTIPILLPAELVITNNQSLSSLASAGGVVGAENITFDPSTVWGGNYSSGLPGTGYVGTANTNPPLTDHDIGNYAYTGD